MTTSTVYQLYRTGQCTYQCIPEVLLTSTQHNILSKSLTAFQHDHCRNNGQRWERNVFCHNDYHQSSEGKLTEPGIEPAIPCSQVLHATDWAVGLCLIFFECENLKCNARIHPNLNPNCSNNNFYRISLHYFHSIEATTNTENLVDYGQLRNTIRAISFECVNSKHNTWIHPNLIPGRYNDNFYSISLHFFHSFEAIHNSENPIDFGLLRNTIRTIALECVNLKGNIR